MFCFVTFSCCSSYSESLGILDDHDDYDHGGMSENFNQPQRGCACGCAVVRLCGCAVVLQWREGQRMSMFYAFSQYGNLHFIFNTHTP